MTAPNTPTGQRLPEGLFIVGRALYGICARCESVVRLNKPIVGSLHNCTPSGELNPSGRY